MEVGIVGKPNVGKSSFFVAATLATAEIANYPFTTIKPNRGVAFVRKPCPHVELGVACNPRNAQCVSGTRLIPVELIDVAGLVPGASQGRGMGNQFLSDLVRAEALIHVVDATGTTDAEGNACSPGARSVGDDVAFLEDEISLWMRDIMSKDWSRMSKQIEMDGKKLDKSLAERFTGLGITENQIHNAFRKVVLGDKPSKWTPDDILRLAKALREAGKPIIVAANKSDLVAKDRMDELAAGEGDGGSVMVPTSAELELALRRATKAGLIDYTPGASTFEIPEPGKLTPPQAAGLAKIKAFLAERGSTGVQQCLEHVVYKVLDRIAVFPVVDETHYTDNDGRVLPDVFLLPRGCTAREMAYKIHTDIGENFIRAIDARTKRVIGADHVLKDGDIIRIVSGA